MGNTVTLGTRIPTETNDLLDKVSKLSSIPKSTLVRNALETYLADMQEAHEILTEIMDLEKGTARTTPLADFEKELDL